jgi:hypothetical protein
MKAFNEVLAEIKALSTEGLEDLVDNFTDKEHEKAVRLNNLGDSELTAIATVVWNRPIEAIHEAQSSFMQVAYRS